MAFFQMSAMGNAIWILPPVDAADVTVSINMRASGRDSDHVVFVSGICRAAILSNAQTIAETIRDAK
jgi:hypothetical protein